uniref:Retinal rod rhodopsin-sensitive cGMP 3',5'-cyclic phosphodiesterase subunit gamma n=1 Tax=Strigops habroptila TaxID=2489341 RepID=A0A672USS5_STRHB
MSLEPPKLEVKSATRVMGGPATPRKGPPKFKQRQTRQFKSKPPKKGVQGFGDDIPGMEGLGTGTGVPSPLHSGLGMGLAAACNGAVVLTQALSSPQISPSSVPGKPSAIWSCTSWRSTASSRQAAATTALPPRSAV